MTVGIQHTRFSLADSRTLVSLTQDVAHLIQSASQFEHQMLNRNHGGVWLPLYEAPQQLLIDTQRATPAVTIAAIAFAQATALRSSLHVRASRIPILGAHVS